MSARQREEAIRWLSRQAEEIRVEVMTDRFRTYNKLKKNHQEQAAILDYAALLIACGKNGWRAERKFRSSAMLTENELLGIGRRQVARAKEQTARHAKIRENIAVHWGEVVELRRGSVSFRGIARHFLSAHGLRISHTTISNLWRQWERYGQSPLD